MKKKAQSKRVGLNQRKQASLQQARVIFMLGLGLALMLALLSYSPNDPSAFNGVMLKEGAKCFNFAGCKGAWIAGLFFGLIGYLSYLIPFALIGLGVMWFKRPTKAAPHDSLNAIVTGLGIFLVIITGTILSHAFFAPDIHDNSGGGLLGKMLSLGLGNMLGEEVLLIFSLALFFIGFTLVTDISWVNVADKVGDWVLLTFDKFQKKATPADKTAIATPQIPLSYEDKPKTLVEKSQQALDKGQKSLSVVVDAVSERLKGSFQRKNGNVYLDDEPYEKEDPLFMEPRQRDYEVRNSTARMKARRVEPLSENEVKSIDLQIPDVDFLRGQSMPSEEQEAEVAPPELEIAKPVPQAPAQTQTEAPKKQAIPKAPRAENAAMITLPQMKLLNKPPPAKQRVTQTKESLHQLATQLVVSLGHYGLNGVDVVECDPGPVITRFELKLPDGTKASRVSGLANDLARNLCVSTVRVVEVIPGRPTIGIEIPNEKRDVVAIREILDAPVFKDSASPLTLALGKDIAGNPVVADLQRMPHLLVAGTTGSGKSVAVNAMLISMLYKATPDEVRMILIDPKMLELNSYENIPHLLTPVVTDMKEASNALRWCVAEMERRYLLMSKLKVRNIAGFNQKILDARERGEEIPDPLFDPQKSMDTQPQALEPLPFIVVVVDEFADMMMVVGKKVEELIARLAQKARASGIHLILATQRPSVDVITGLIKANIPTRMAFQVSTKIDSRTILDQGGAEQLLGYGDMLYMPPGVSMPNRVHGALVTDQEVEDVATFLKYQMEPDYIEGVIVDAGDDGVPGLGGSDSEAETDPLYDEAVAIVTESRRASISYLQRRLKVGYNRAARMIEDMEAAGVVSAVQGNGTREVLAPAPVQG